MRDKMYARCMYFQKCRVVYYHLKSGPDSSESEPNSRHPASGALQHVRTTITNTLACGGEARGRGIRRLGRPGRALSLRLPVRRAGTPEATVVRAGTDDAAVQRGQPGLSSAADFAIPSPPT